MTSKVSKKSNKEIVKETSIKKQESLPIEESINLLSNLTIDETLINDKLTKFDKVSIDLLNELDLYLIKYESLNMQLKNGFLDLKRANYASFDSNKFGKDSWDLRLCLASKNLQFDKENQIQLLDLIEKVKEKNQLELNKIEINKLLDLKTTNSKSVKMNETTVQNRKFTNKTIGTQKATEKEEEDDEEEEEEDRMVLRDPIHMFNGGFVPLTLRQSKKSFDSSLLDIIELANLKLKLLKLVEELEI